MLRLLGWVRPILRWLFAIEAAALATETIYVVYQHLLLHRPPFTAAEYSFHAATLSLTLLFAAAWFVTRPPRATRSILAVLACVVNAGLALLMLVAVERMTWDVVAFNLALLVASLASIYAFLVPEAAAPQAAPHSPAPIPGDCTLPWLDKTYPVLFIAVILASWHFWDKWALGHSLPYTPFLLQLLWITLAQILTVLIHESGHAIAAFILRRKLLSFVVGPFQWSLFEGRWIFRFHPIGLVFIAGGINAIPRDAGLSRDNDTWVVAAGPLANLLSAPVLFWLMFQIPGSHLAAAWLFFASMATFSVAVAIFNLLPMRSCGTYSDGARLLQMFTGSPILELLNTERRLQSTLVTPLRFRDLDPEAIERAAALYPGTVAAIRYHLCAAGAHEDAGRIPQAAASIAVAETIYNDHAVNLPASLHTVFIVFHACRNRDAAAARLWWDRMATKKIERKNVDYWLAVASLAYIEGRAPDAEAAWQNADAEGQKLPPFGAYQNDCDRVAFLRTLLDGPIPELVTLAAPISAAVPSATTSAPAAKQPLNRSALLTTAAIAIVMLIAVAAIQLRTYIDAVAWHSRHGNYAQLGAHRVRLPALWWTRVGPTNESSVLARAHTGVFDTDYRSRPQITVLPADEDEVLDSDQDELEDSRDFVTAMNQHARKGRSSSLVVLRSKSFSLYCDRTDYLSSDDMAYTDLTCRTARFPDLFLYSGPTAREPEAESILSTLE